MKLLFLILILNLFESCVNADFYSDEEIAVAKECDEIIYHIIQQNTIVFNGMDTVVKVPIDNVNVEKYNSKSSFGINRKLE